MIINEELVTQLLPTLSGPAAITMFVFWLRGFLKNASQIPEIANSVKTIQIDISKLKENEANYLALKQMVEHHDYLIKKIIDKQD